MKNSPWEEKFTLFLKPYSILSDQANQALLQTQPAVRLFRTRCYVTGRIAVYTPKAEIDCRGKFIVVRGGGDDFELMQHLRVYDAETLEEVVQWKANNFNVRIA